MYSLEFIDNYTMGKTNIFNHYLKSNKMITLTVL